MSYSSFKLRVLASALVLALAGAALWTWPSWATSALLAGVVGGVVYGWRKTLARSGEEHDR